ncbi:MAG: tetratricopeptide repeat protein, partial [Myxococcota bacterium]|nr:tetratricopeptide repeat protein [Myxococcota bacterium]
MTLALKSARLSGLVSIVLASSLLGLAGCAGSSSPIPGLESLLSASEHRENVERQRARTQALDAPTERKPRTFDDWMAEGDRFKARGNGSRAYLAYRRAQTLEPENPLPRRRIAFLAIREEPIVARNLFAELLQDDPTDAVLLYGLAFAELQSGRISAARSALDHAVALNPELTSAQKLLGVVCDRMDDRDAAQHHYRRALESEPNDLSTL